MIEQAAARHDGREFEELLRLLRTGPPVTIGDGAFVPLLHGGSGPDADLLDEAIQRGLTEITEVNEQGEVGRVRVSHRGPRLLLLIDGEQLVGAKQNRVLNASFLVPAGGDVTIPVSCVERGRWGYAGRTFAPSPTTLHSRGRRRKLSRVTSSVAAGRGYDAEQGEVWRDVAEFVEQTGTCAPTEAFEDAARARRRATDDSLRSLAPRDSQVGLALVQQGRLTVMDLFGSADLFARAWQKVAAGMLADIADGEPAPGHGSALVDTALAGLRHGSWTRRAAPGCGETIHGRADGLVVGAVVHEGALYHAVVAAIE